MKSTFIFLLVFSLDFFMRKFVHIYLLLSEKATY